MITFGYQKSTRLILMGLAGILVAVSGALIYVFSPVQLIIAKCLELSPNSIIFNIWSDPGYDVFIKCYVFNITNADEFLAGKEKLKVEQIGPYVYQETLYNMNGTFNPNGTLTFVQRRYLKFRRDKSVGDTSDNLVSVNIPLLGISSSLKESGFLVKIALAQIANGLDSKTILRLTVDQYLFGYDDALVTLANNALPNWINFERFGILDRLMALDNATNEITIRTTNPVKDDDVSTYPYDNMPYSITRFNGNPGLPQWGYKDDKSTIHEENIRCNTIQGSYVEGLYPTFLNENTTIRMYRRAFCRPVDFVLVNKERQDGTDVLNLKMANNYLYTPKENPDNICYCYKGVCPRKGLGYITPCYYGIPIILSQPHFFNADPSLLEEVDGLSPNESEHGTTLSLHADLGVPVKANMRIQINLEVDTSYSTRCKPFNGMTIPLFWLELEIESPPQHIQFLFNILYNVLPVAQQVCCWLFMLLGMALLASSALLMLYAPSGYGLEDPYNKIGYSPIRIIPMTQYLVSQPGAKVFK